MHYHNGFNYARQVVSDNLKNYLNGIPKKNVKYVITGHSLGGAVAQLLSLNLTDPTGSNVSNENVFNYNFGCPDVARCNPIDWNPSGTHDNIFNIAHAGDPVSVVPGAIPQFNDILFQWGKFGISRWFSYDWNDPSKVNIVDIQDHYVPERYLDYLSRLEPLSSYKTWVELQAMRAKDLVESAIAGLNSFISDLIVVNSKDIKISKTACTLYTPGASKQTSFALSVSIKKGEIAYLSFRSSDSSVASVDNKTGLVKSKNKGTANITAIIKVRNGDILTTARRTCKITVKNPTLQISPMSATIRKGKTKKIQISTEPSATAVYSTSNKAVAAVNSKGVITANRIGKCNIYVKCNGITKTVKITVK